MAVAGHWVRQVGLDPTSCICTSAQGMWSCELLRDSKEQCKSRLEQGEGRGGCAGKYRCDGAGKAERFSKVRVTQSRPRVTASRCAGIQMCSVSSCVQGPPMSCSSHTGTPAMHPSISTWLQLCAAPAVHGPGCGDRSWACLQLFIAPP